MSNMLMTQLMLLLLFLLAIVIHSNSSLAWGRATHIICPKHQIQACLKHPWIIRNAGLCAWNALQTYCKCNCRTRLPKQPIKFLSMQVVFLFIASLLAKLVLSVLRHTFLSKEPQTHFFTADWLVINYLCFNSQKKVWVTNHNVQTQERNAEWQMSWFSENT